MKKGLISKIFVILLVVGLLFADSPTRQAQAANDLIHSGRYPSIPSPDDDVTVWIQSDTTDVETVHVEYVIDDVSKEVDGQKGINILYPEANWYAVIPAQSLGKTVTYRLIVRDENGNKKPSFERFSYTVMPGEVFVDDDFNSETTGWDVTHFATIQQGIDGVADGGKVKISAGTYQEGITVTGRSIDLIGERDGEGVPIVVINGWLSISNSDPFTSFEIKDIYFKGTNSHLLKLSNVDGRLDIDNCVFDGMGRFMTEPHINGINLNTTIEVYVKNSVFKEGLYVGINGYNAGWIEVYDSEFINIKSGINLQSNSHSVQIDRNYFKIKPVSETDSYGVRFGSETGNANGLWMRRNTIEVDRTGGYTPSAGNYHAAIIIRAGVDPDAGPGNIYFTDNVINDELVTFYKVEYLDTYFAANTWPEGYGVLGNKITLIKPPQTIYLPLIFK